MCVSTATYQSIRLAVLPHGHGEKFLVQSTALLRMILKHSPSLSTSTEVNPPQDATQPQTGLLLLPLRRWLSEDFFATGNNFFADIFDSFDLSADGPD